MCITNSRWYAEWFNETNFQPGSTKASPNRGWFFFHFLFCSKMFSRMRIQNWIISYLFSWFHPLASPRWVEVSEVLLLFVNVDMSRVVDYRYFRLPLSICSDYKLQSCLKLFASRYANNQRTSGKSWKFSCQKHICQCMVRLSLEWMHTILIPIINVWGPCVNKHRNNTAVTFRILMTKSSWSSLTQLFVFLLNIVKGCFEKPNYLMKRRYGKLCPLLKGEPMLDQLNFSVVSLSKIGSASEFNVTLY